MDSSNKRPAEFNLEDISSYDLIEELKDRYEWPEEADLGNYTTDELISEVEFRGFEEDIWLPGSTGALYDIWLKRRMGKPFDLELDNLIYKVIGKVV